MVPHLVVCEEMEEDEKESFNPNIFLTLTGSKNAPFACYEEIQAQRDRFGNCGLERGRYRMCMWRYAVQMLKMLIVP